MTQRKFSVEPLYVQVRNLLAQRIADGVWPPGTMLPNEIELARELGVSSGTVRKALDTLESERLVARRQGRGTSVVDQASGELAARFSNVRDKGGARIVSDAELLEQTGGAANDIERLHLQLKEGDPVLRTVRLRRYKGRPFMHERSVLAIGRFRGMREEEAGNYRISALAQQHGVQLARASERVTVEKPAPEIAKRLGVAPDTWLLKLDRILHTSSDGSVEWREALCALGEDLLYLAEMT
jgi:GntR family transcriptional regulator